MKKTTKKEKKPDEELNKILVENFVNLQKVLTNLSAKFDYLSDNISKLLQLFEISAKSFVEKQKNIPQQELIERQRDLREREFTEKIDKILDQNRTIAKGITLMDEKIKENLAKEKRILKTIDDEVEEMSELPQFQPKDLPRI